MSGNDDALILHGRDGGQLNLAERTPDKADTLLPWLAALFPDMPGQMREDLLPLLKGNLAHIAHVRQLNRTLDIQHREWMICVGRGFDFLHMPNLALIIGPYSPNLDDPIRKAAGIIQSNMVSGRLPDDGYLLLPSSPYDEIGMDRARAEMKARFMSEFTAQVIKAELPALELAAWFLEPNDAAVSKYARMEPRDREWIRPGLQAGVLSLAILKARFSETSFLDAAESASARRALEEDRRWLAGRFTRGR